MVNGFDKFREAFSKFSENYIVIGGTACDWLFSRQNIPFRATKDIDLVLVAETMTPAFARALRSFLSSGGYHAYERKDGKRCFYRFGEPSSAAYPYMLELFAKSPFPFQGATKSTAVPIPVEDDDVSSLSGILLNDDYYDLLRSSRQTVDGICVPPPEVLLLLKAKAWLNLTECKASGGFVKDRDLRKHRTDILRLQALALDDAPLAMTPALHEDAAAFLKVYERMPLDPSQLGVPGTFSDAIAKIRRLFGI